MVGLGTGRCVWTDRRKVKEAGGIRRSSPSCNSPIPPRRNESAEDRVNVKRKASTVKIDYTIASLGFRSDVRGDEGHARRDVLYGRARDLGRKERWWMTVDDWGFERLLIVEQPNAPE